VFTQRQWVAVEEAFQEGDTRRAVEALEWLLLCQFQA
jgi:hypothetical protein